MTIKEVQSWTELPAQGIQVWHPSFKYLPLEDCIKQSCIVEQYSPYGYNYAILCRSTATIHVYQSIITAHV
jgi:hypothetical protein